MAALIGNRRNPSTRGGKRKRRARKGKTMAKHSRRRLPPRIKSGPNKGKFRKRRSSKGKRVVRLRRGKSIVVRANPNKRIRKKRSDHPRRLNPIKAGSALARAYPGMAGKSMPAAAPKRKRRKGKKAHRKGRKYSRKSRAHKAPKLHRRRRTVKAARKRYRRMLKKVKGTGRKARGRRAKYRAKLAALSVSRRRPGVSSKFARKARQFGLARSNPGSLMSAVKDWAGTLGMAAGVGVVTLGLAWGANKLSQKLPEAVKAKVPAMLVPYVPALSVGLLSLVAYVGLRMASSKMPMLQKMVMPVALGTGGAAALLLAAAVPMKMKDAAGNEVATTLGKKLGLPIGEFVGVSGYVALPSGQQVAVNGLGEFVGVSGAVMLPSGQSVQVNGMGDYLHEEVGLSGFGSIFNESSLGAATPEQEAMGRDPSHGMGDETSMEDIVGEGGSLSGDIFDD